MGQSKPSVRMKLRILRLPAVLEFSGLSETQLEDRIKHGAFPKPIRISERAKGWLESELTEWLDQRIAERDASA